MNTATPIGIILMVAVCAAAHAQTNTPQTEYETLAALMRNGVTNEKFDSFVSSLTKEQCHSFLKDVAAHNPKQVEGTFEFLDVFAARYFTTGSGTNYTTAEWISDVNANDLPIEWREIIMRRLGSMPTVHKDQCQPVLQTLMSTNEPSGIQRSAMLAIGQTMAPREYRSLLNALAESAEHSDYLRHEATLHSKRLQRRDQIERVEQPH